MERKMKWSANSVLSIRSIPRCRIPQAVVKMVFILSAIFLLSLFTEFRMKNSMALNAEQLENLQHRSQSVIEPRRDGSVVSLEAEELDEKSYQSKNGATEQEDDEEYGIPATEENNEDEEHGIPATEENNEDEEYDDNDENVDQHEGDDSVTLGKNKNGGDEDDSQDKAKNGVKVLDTIYELSRNPQAAQNSNNSSRNASEEKVLSSTFIPFEPDTSPLRHSPDIPKRFLIEEADYCQQRPKLQIITYIHSSISRVSQRNDTRSTWGNASAYDMGPMNVSIGVVFMVGRAKNEQEQRIVQEESERYHDIVQGDYGDHYRLLTYKGLAGLYWINQHCAHVPWVLHSDDDTHIDIFLYHRTLQQLDEASKQKFVCSFMYGPALRYGRYKVRYEEYPAKEYPLYCSGGVWFLQTRLIPRLLEARKTVPYVWVDDAYITGLLARRAGIGHLPFQKYYGGPHVLSEKLGKELVWFVKFAPRSVWWQKIVDYHKNHSMHQPVTLPPLK